MNQNPQSFSGDDRRQYKRIAKNFILTYYDKSDPKKKYEISQLKNISLGGMCFITSKGYPPGTKIAIELKTPYISDTTYLEGTVVGANEKVKNIIYETRLKFDVINPQAEFLLAKLIDFFISGRKSIDEQD